MIIIIKRMSQNLISLIIKIYNNNNNNNLIIFKIIKAINSI
jgi:hypothetical protein